MDRCDSRRSAHARPEGPAPLVLTVREAAELLRCSEETIYQLIYSGRLRALRPSRRFVIPRRALETFLDGRYRRES